jgi:4-amino-4-deoxy-L-arabinose transferase-like glycosyltransferase
MGHWGGDEYVYKSIASYIWRNGGVLGIEDGVFSVPINLPNLIYPYLISPAFFFEQYFYFIIKLINSVVINLAIFPIYFLSRNLFDKKTSLLVGIASLSIPFLGIGAYAVTEVLYFPVFCIFLLLAYRTFDQQENLKWWILCGAISGLMMQIRLNGLILFPTLILSHLLHDLRLKKINVRTYFNSFIGLIILAGIYLLAKKILNTGHDLGLGFYAKVLPGVLEPFKFIAENPISFLHLWAGHIAIVFIPFGFIICKIVIDYFSRKDTEIKIDALAVAFTFVSILFSVVYTISVSSVDLGGMLRWHSRYYFYIYPLLIIVFANIFINGDRFNSKIMLSFPLFAVFITNIYFIFVFDGQANPWFGALVDSLDVQWYRFYRVFYFVQIFLFLLTIFCYVTNNICYKKLVILGFSIWIIIGNIGVIKNKKLIYEKNVTKCSSYISEFLSMHPGRFIFIARDRDGLINEAFLTPYVPVKSYITSDLEFDESYIEGVRYIFSTYPVTFKKAKRELLSIDECRIYSNE